MEKAAGCLLPSRAQREYKTPAVYYLIWESEIAAFGKYLRVIDLIEKFSRESRINCQSKKSREAFPNREQKMRHVRVCRVRFIWFVCDEDVQIKTQSVCSTHVSQTRGFSACRNRMTFI